MRSRTGRRTLRKVRDESGTLREVRYRSGTLGEVRDGLEDPWRGQERVGGPMERS